jgi:ATP-dependent protease ClpP protease subunit
VIPQLVAIEESEDIEGLIIILNTVGGDVEAGLAIAELISGMKKPTVSFVLGGGHSIGVPLAVAAKKSYIAPSATMTVHPVRTNGLMIGVPRMMNHFARMQSRITEFVVSHSNISAEKFTELMMNTKEMVTDVGSVISGERAVEVGLIDSIGNLSTVIETLYKMIDETK